MIQWGKFPLARLVLWMVFAIYAFEFLPQISLSFYVILVGVLLLFTYLVHQFKLKNIQNILNVLLVISLALGNCALHSPTLQNNHILNQNNIEFYKVEISEDLYPTSNGYRSTGDILHVYFHDTLRETNGGVLLFLDKNINTQKFKKYNKITFKVPLARIKKAKNPNQVDFSEIYQKKNIYYQVYLKNEDILLFDENINWFQKIVRNAKDFTLNSLDKFIPNPNNAALAKAMLIGYKNTLEKQTVQAFIDTGLVHILAVSGMHVGLILIMVKLILKMCRWKENKWIVLRSFVVILALVFYAILTGLSPSVVRAVLMFSVLELGYITKQKYNSYNSLAASAIILLIINPNDFYNLGFLLSFGAMLGIFAFYKSFKNLIYIKNKLIENIWSIICLSMAAQLGTLSITLFYFHQFPTYFLLANVLVLPLLVPIITYGSVVLVCFSFLPFLAKWFGIFLNECIYITIDIVKILQQFPHSKITFIFLDSIEFLVISLVIILFAFLVFEYKKSRMYVLLSIAIFGISYNIVQFVILPQNNFTVYHQNKHVSFSIQHQYSADVYMENADNNQFFYANIIEPSLRKNGILFIQVFDKNDWENCQNNSQQFEIITANKYPKIDTTNTSKFYIISSNNSYKFDSREQEYLKKRHQKFHSVLQNNAYEYFY